MKSILIIGGSGFLGENLIHYVNRGVKFYFTYYSSELSNDNRYKEIAYKLDIRNKEEVHNLFNQIVPDIVIHIAAITNFQLCATQQKLAREVNVEGTLNLVMESERIKARFIYISSDLVFDGERMFYSEKDVPKPICYYGKTKFEGELLVSSISSNYCIARISLIFGLSLNQSKSFSETIIENLKNSKEVKLFIDEYRSPIYVLDLCAVIFEIAKNQNIQGIYNICGGERISRYEFGLKLCEFFGFDKNLIIPTKIDDFPFLDNRPKDCSMNNMKIRNVLKGNFRSIEQGIANFSKLFSN